ncbi:MAG TPA: undecaprenyl-diphosphate phosphatase [Bacteroidales bacterium]|nr:undecaprenyl-diphosphate phosphatase [Bacteroidales bacterium]HNS46038.1 undecaprenyl-diphosphate phosphatase [Bacteroidales bacterium]
MDGLTALILGLIQGLTEFLPVSSSGHLELGKVLFGLQGSENLTFTVVVHGATVLSTLVVFYKDILRLLKGLLAFRWNPEMQFMAKILISMVPVAFLGFFFREEVEAYFTGNTVFVGSMLIITAILLGLTTLVKQGLKTIPFLDAMIIGIAQAVAVLPGISRSGATISTGLLLRNQKEDVTRFSFLMVIIPVLGANFMDLTGGNLQNNVEVGSVPLLIGFVSAFISGLIACKWMVGLVKKGKLKWFALYCLVIGIVAIIWGG